ncbi:Superoxide dismutase [Operophtera brumata]|uniref:superoxide dismutase n=1 Tax=Operophtera brumata TaxID=104452 RepID=A0A0L7LPU8_OPEBR|nr:Superoxide dismutase [Operophtera brumata]
MCMENNYMSNSLAYNEYLTRFELLSSGDIETIINLGPAIKFNGGGHINHTIFWQNLSANGGKPSDELTKAAEK